MVVRSLVEGIACLPMMFGFAVHAGYLGEPKATVAEVQHPERVFTNNAGRLCVDFGKDAFGWIEIDAPAAGLDVFLAMGEHLWEESCGDRP